MAGRPPLRFKRRDTSTQGNVNQLLGRNIRGEIAYRAARLIAEGGVTDLATAKRKAARQMAVTKAGFLPDDDEVDAALRAYQSIFQVDSQPQECRALRHIAVDAMRWLDRFSPWLIGSVMTGTANRYSPIEFEIVTDEAKRLEMFFVNLGMPFATKVRVAHSSALYRISVYEITFQEVQIVIATYPTHAARAGRLQSGNLKRACAQLTDVEALAA